MKRLASLFVVAVVMVLIGCNMIGRKDEILARVGDRDLMKSELDFALSSMPPERRADIEARKNVFNNLLESRILSEAARKMVPQAAPTVEAKLADLQKRDLASVYQRFYIQENLAHTEDQLYSWFRKHEKEFKDTVEVDFKTVRDSVVKRLTLEEKATDVRKFFEQNKAQFSDRNAVDIGLLTSADSVKLAQAIVQIASGAAFDAVAPTILTDSSLLARKGHLGVVVEGTQNQDLVPVMGSVMQLFDLAKRPKAGTFLPIVQVSSEPKMYAAITAFHYQDAKAPTFESLKTKVEAAYLNQYRQGIAKTSSDSLKSQYKVELAKIPVADAKAVYEKSKDQYKTQQSYRVLHVGSNDSTKLAKIAEGLKSEADFRAAGGKVLIAKVSHCLPDSLGMFPELFNALDGRMAGFKTPILKAPDSQKYEVFWLLESIAPQVKSFDRARKEVEARLMEGEDVELDSNFVLVSVDGSPAIWERDIMKLRQEVPPQQRRQYNRERLLTFLVDWELANRAAKKLKLEEGAEFKALCALRSSDMWANVFRDSIITKTMGYPVAELKKVFQQNPGKVFEGKSIETSMLEAALWLDLPDYAYQREFALRPEQYPSAKDWKAAKVQIFKRIKDVEVRGAQERLNSRIRKDLDVEILDTTLGISELNSAKEILADGMKKYEARQLPEAKAAFQKVRDLFPTDTATIRATMMIAQAFNEEEQFQQALDEYTVLYAVWPNHVDAYKAIFMKGFILSENLKQDSLALKAFQAMLSKYPKSDLSDDADWMVRNIQSGGKLAPALLDSIAKLDSIQAVPTQK